MKEELFPIDIVLDWVDGSDVNWQDEKRKYEDHQSIEEKKIDDIRFRDWDCLRYLFRGIEKFTPWVNKVYFVTCGQVPEWLNLDCPKLVLVSHKDYIPQKYLPTFNSNTIELNYHRIKGLSEHFIVINDDMYFTNYLKREDFFKNNLPVDVFMEYPISCGGGASRAMAHRLVNNYCLLGDHFSRAEYRKKLRWKIMNVKYGALFFYNLFQYFVPYPKFFGVLTPHFAMPYLKKSFEEVWELEEEKLDSTCMNKFRNDNCLNIYIMRIWSLLQGHFSPKNILKDGKLMLCSDSPELFDNIVKQKYKRICLNDTKCTFEEYKIIKQKLHDSFEKIMPEKSGFEI